MIDRDRFPTTFFFIFMHAAAVEAAVVLQAPTSLGPWGRGGSEGAPAVRSQPFCARALPCVFLGGPWHGVFFAVAFVCACEILWRRVCFVRACALHKIFRPRAACLLLYCLRAPASLPASLVWCLMYYLVLLNAFMPMHNRPQTFPPTLFSFSF